MSCLSCFILFFFFKQKTAYEMRISDWSSDVCSSDLYLASFGRLLFRHRAPRLGGGAQDAERRGYVDVEHCFELFVGLLLDHAVAGVAGVVDDDVEPAEAIERASDEAFAEIGGGDVADTGDGFAHRSEEQQSELQ